MYCTFQWTRLVSNSVEEAWPTQIFKKRKWPFPLKGMKETACAKQEDSINLIIQNISVHQNGLGTNHIPVHEIWWKQWTIKSLSYVNGFLTMLYSSSVKKLRCYPNSKFLNRTTGPEIFENQNPKQKKDASGDWDWFPYQTPAQRC